jgi:hypothetical protein
MSKGCVEIDGCVAACQYTLIVAMKTIAFTVSIALIGTAACDRRSSTSAPAASVSPAAPVVSDASDRPSPTTASATPPSTAKPFEGHITLKLADNDPSTVQYAAKGDKIKLGVRRAPGGAQDVDVIVDRGEKKISLLLPDQKKYTTLDAGELEKKARQYASQVQLVKTGKTETIAGRTCEEWTLTDRERRITACVTQGPAYFDVAALEKATNFELPAWAERIIAEGYFPLRISVTDTQGKPITQSQVLSWTEGPVEEGDFKVPEDYQRVEQQAVQADVRRRIEKATPR